MRVTGLGHAGLFVETAAGTVLCDPWQGPSYFASWFPFPDNRGLDWDDYLRPDYLYVSHLHLDHFDPAMLRRVDKGATVLVPDYPTDELRASLADLGFRSFVQPENGEPRELDGLRFMILSLTSPADGPIGDSLLALDDGQARLLNQNDAHPPDVAAITNFGRYDAHALQFSGAIWWPVVYDFPPAAKAEFGRRKRANGLARALRYAQEVGARHVFPIAGPACFLDEALFAFNDLQGDDANPFPDQTVFVDYLRDHGLDGRLLLPGSAATLAGGPCEVRHRLADDEIRAIFEDKPAYLKAYAERERLTLEQARMSWPRGQVDLLSALKERWEPLLAEAERICEGVGGPVQFVVTDPAGDLSLVIDFPARQVRQWAGESCRYRFRVARPLVEACVADDEQDWVNSLFLSLRFEAGRVGPYNEYVYTFFKCLSRDRIAYVEGWYAEQSGGDEDVQLDGWEVQRRCPHMKADLARFGSIEEGVLTCSMHGWRFDLASGRCLTSAGHELRARPAEEPAPVT